MKQLSFLISTLILGITIVVCKIWAIISFILYLVKDTPFNWTVLWIGVISIVVLIVIYLLSIFNIHKEINKEPIRYPGEKSKFQTRLEEAQRLQKERLRK